MAQTWAAWVLAVSLAGATALPSNAQSAEVIHRPYLQSVSSVSARIVFRMGSDCPAQVRYGKGSELTQVARADADGRQHAIVLSDLLPGTEYGYVAEACGEAVDAPRRFRTAPAFGSGEVQFGVLGDFGSGSKAQKAVAAAIHAARPELLVTVGDNIYVSGTDAEFGSNFLAPMGALLAEVPLFPSLGNHEYVTREGQPYLDNFYLPANNARGTERYYSFDWGSVHFVSLDSMCLLGMTSEAKCTADEQLAWLEEDLSTSRAPWKVVSLHHSVWSSGFYGNNRELQERLAPVLEAGGVDLVFTGHEHDYERTRPMKAGAQVAEGTPGGVVYFVTGSGGASLRPFPIRQPTWSAFRDNERHGYLNVSVRGGRLEARMLTAEGDVLDSYVKEKSLAADGPIGIFAAAEPARGAAPLDVLLAAETSSPEAEVTWTLAPGRTAAGLSTRMHFDTPGTYAVQVEARRGDEVVSQTVNIQVEPAPPGGGDGHDSGEAGPGGEAGPAGCGVTPSAAWSLVAIVPVAWALVILRKRSRPIIRH